MVAAGYSTHPSNTSGRSDCPRRYTALKYTSISWLKLTYNGRIQENMGHLPGTNHIFVKTY